MMESGDQASLLQATRQLAQDGAVEVRRQAMEAAGRLVSDGGLDVLQEGLRDSDTNVWQVALDEVVKCANGQADKALTQVVPILTQRLGELQHESGEKVEERIDKLLSALARTDTEESSDVLFAAMLSDIASPAFVANVLARRRDPRAVRAVLVDLTFEMLEFPDEYLEMPWRDFIFTGKELPEGRKEFVEAELNSLFGRPFELGWLESLLIPEDATLPWLEHDLALVELSQLCRSNRAALSLLLWTCLIAWGKLVEWTEATDSLLDATIWHLIEIDPSVLVELIPDTAQRSLLWAAGEFAVRLLRSASAMTGALSHDKRQELQELLDLYTD